jgi:hypothetical protein
MGGKLRKEQAFYHKTVCELFAVSESKFIEKLFFITATCECVCDIRKILYLLAAEAHLLIKIEL